MTNPSPEVTAYVDQAAILMDLSLHPEHRPGVITNFERIQTIAALVNDFPLPDDLEPAPVFEP
ncbi:MAG: DUF4089 domain-containing protein [Leptolyngbyaceae cyanobacterium bins.59]|nr:DUF4089 domain-containing protein [Leptolyngbyaceae cyanobacterium bins.59]